MHRIVRKPGHAGPASPCRSSTSSPPSPRTPSPRGGTLSMPAVAVTRGHPADHGRAGAGGGSRPRAVARPQPGHPDLDGRRDRRRRHLDPRQHGPVGHDVRRLTGRGGAELQPDRPARRRSSWRPSPRCSSRWRYPDPASTRPTPPARSSRTTRMGWRRRWASWARRAKMIPMDANPATAHLLHREPAERARADEPLLDAPAPGGAHRPAPGDARLSSAPAPAFVRAAAGFPTWGPAAVAFPGRDSRVTGSGVGRTLGSDDPGPRAHQALRNARRAPGRVARGPGGPDPDRPRPQRLRQDHTRPSPGHSRAAHRRARPRSPATTSSAGGTRCAA